MTDPKRRAYRINEAAAEEAELRFRAEGVPDPLGLAGRTVEITEGTGTLTTDPLHLREYWD
ncbi:hypothetical protein [Rhodopseudomonas palustris]|uniref:hypothetical protein n=1 Tax=Rhodopseudomonas palustris TaxID=1076 RepID=UPI000D1C0B72|nr:hypothetical protein [Rhodopseudomonas palustris]AVT83654.1 hypothetical protein RPYSC3_47940 [Rhodopseudomonas palustris]